ncbi:MAG: hypothetical protein R3F39_15165 [Myxococcota bacterium]
MNNAAVAFGYRVLPVEYGRKQDTKCSKPVVNCAESPLDGETRAECEDRQADCRIDTAEQWLVTLAPFGTISAASASGFAVEVDPVRAEALSPGVYPATVQVAFDNGDTDSIRVELTKASPSGSYLGTLTIAGVPAAQGQAVSLTGQRPIRFDMRMAVTKEVQQWNALMSANNVINGSGQDQSAGSFKDLNQGQVVTALLNADTALPFSWTGSGANEVPFTGIYEPGSGRMRLLGVIEIAANFCVDEDGDTCPAAAPATCDPNAPLQVRNPFGRRIRRQIEFFGRFDEAAARFSGTYIETVRGLLPNTPITLEGDFSMQQLVADGSPLKVQVPLVPATLMAYPENELQTFTDAEGNLDAAALAGVATACAGANYAHEKASFADKAAFDTYIKAARRASAPGSGTDGTNVLGKTVVFPAAVAFRSHIEAALKALANSDGVSAQDQADYLSIYDYVSDWIEPCTSADQSPSPFCLNEDQARCGLALHRKALLSGWVSLENLKSGGIAQDGELPIFCADDIPLQGCPAAAFTGEFSDHRGLFTLQEHNRFWSLLAQAWKFDGDRARTDAFLTLFRNEVNPFVAGTARSYKAEQLRLGVCRYDQAVDLMASTASAVVLGQWPASSFTGGGRDWLTIMYAVARDRMDILAELIDLRRRVFLATDAADFRFAQHLMQHEYLLQVYLMALQSRWQGEKFVYTGSAAEALEVGQQMLAQLNPARTVVGTVPERVFFENSDPSRSNWEHYRERIAGPGGLLEEAQDQVADAVSNLRGALVDLDTFETNLFTSGQYLEERLDGLCGSADLLSYTKFKGQAPAGAGTPCSPACAAGYVCHRGGCLTEQAYFDMVGPADYCQAVLMEHWDDTAQWSSAFNEGQPQQGGALGGTAPVTAGISCPSISAQLIDLGNPCQDVVTSFKTAAAAINVPNPQNGPTAKTWTPPTCNLEHTKIVINGQMRPCAGGEIGALLQEKALVDLNRKHTLRQLASIVSRLEAFASWHKLMSKNTDFIQALEYTFAAASQVKDLVLALSKLFEKTTQRLAGAPDCLLVAGLAVGTDCPQSAISVVLSTTTQAISDGAQLAINQAFSIVEQLKNIGVGELEQQKGAAERLKDFNEIAHELDGVVDAYQLWTQESFNLGLQIADLRQQAQSAADRYRDGVSFTAGALVGRETGFALLGNHLVGEASKTFRDLVNTTYRMAMAYNHRFNLAPDVAKLLVNRAVSVTTLDEVADFVALLDSTVEDYCGVEGVDCDANNNNELLRFSLREQVFPNLRAKVDPSSGAVLVSVGEQFHNLITTPPYVRRRVRGPLVVDQVEVPFGLPLTLLENQPGGPTWLLNPLDCNHLVAAPDFAADGVQNLGTLAVQVVGKNLGASAGIQYQLQRGGTDFVRSCHIEAVQAEIGTLPVETYPIRRHIVGYAPENAFNGLSSVPSFVTRSSMLQACVNEEEEDVGDGGCWRYFARDRSLAALDWKLIIPLNVDGGNTQSAWISGEGLTAADKPVIEDIIIYFRYRTRPVQEL